MSSCWMYFPKLSSQIVFEMCIQKFPGSHKCQFYWKDYLNWYKEYCRRKCTLSCSFRLFQFETDYLMTLRYINLVFVRKAMPYIWLMVLYKFKGITIILFNSSYKIIHCVIWGWWIVFIVINIVIYPNLCIHSFWEWMISHATNFCVLYRWPQISVMSIPHNKLSKEHSSLVVIMLLEFR